jgi:hypothetical protein
VQLPIDNPFLIGWLGWQLLRSAGLDVPLMQISGVLPAICVIILPALFAWQAARTAPDRRRSELVRLVVPVVPIVITVVVFIQLIPWLTETRWMLMPAMVINIALLFLTPHLAGRWVRKHQSAVSESAE